MQASIWQSLSVMKVCEVDATPIEIEARYGVADVTVESATVVPAERTFILW